MSDRSGTTFHICSTGADYAKAHAFVRSERDHDPPLTLPTILAIEDDEVVGIMGTEQDEQMIRVGVFMTKSDRPRVFTALRMVEVYDNVMRNMGISTYVALIVREDARMQRMLDRVGGFEVIGENADGILYARRL